jgi:hypothetical protein
MGAAISDDHLVFFCEIGDLVNKIINGPAVAMYDQQRFSFTINFAVHFESADIIIFPR